VLLSLALVAQSPSAAARDAPALGLAAALGPEVAIVEPSGGYVGRLTVAPEHGPAGTPLTVTAEGLPAGEEFQLVWRTVDGAWKAYVALSRALVCGSDRARPVTRLLLLGTYRR
jgi:hypothetical protein